MFDAPWNSTKASVVTLITGTVEFNEGSEEVVMPRPDVRLKQRTISCLRRLKQSLVKSHS